jgi:hypothetical protein
MKLLIKKFSCSRFKKISIGLLYFLQILFILCSTKIIEKIYEKYIINQKYIELLSYYNNFLMTSKYFIFLDFIIYFIPTKYDLKNINTLFFVIYDLINNYKNCIQIYENFHILNNKFFFFILSSFILMKTNFQICALLNIFYSICNNIFIKKETSLSKILHIDHDIEKGFEY